MFEIFSYGGADFLRYIFSGIAMIFGSDSYLLALGAASILGILGWMCSVAFAGGGKALNPGWFIGVLVLYYGAIVPKVDVLITDKVNPANTSTVSNVPLAIASVGYIFSSFKVLMTEASETVFSLPNGVRYSQTGLLFTTKLTEEITQTKINDARQELNWQEFYKNCVYYDIVFGLYGWSDISTEADLLGYFQTNTSQARMFNYVDNVGAETLVTCRTGVSTMAGELTAYLDNSRAPLILARLNFVDDPDDTTRNTQAVTRYAAAMPVGLTYLTGLSQNSSQLMQQAALMNSLKRGLVNFANDADASAAAQDFAAARAEAERENTFIVMGEVAKKFMPMANHLFEAIIYAVVPLVMVICMTPLIGKALIAYLTMLFWISLWGPLFAIINFGSTYYTAMETKARLAYESSSGTSFTSGFNLLTSSNIGELMGYYASVTGYLLVFVPMIAYMLVSRSGAMMAGLAGRFMQGYERPVASASDEATKGNIDLGNTRLDTHSAFQANVSPSVESGMASYRDSMGVKHNITGGGETSEHNMSRAPVDLSFAKIREQSTGQAYQEAQSQSAQARSTASEANLSALRTVDQVATDVQNSIGVGTKSSEEFRAGYDRQVADLQSSFERYADSVGMGDSFRASGGLQLVGTGISKEGMTKDMQEVVDGFTQQQDFKQGFKELTDYVKAASANLDASTADKYTDSLDASYSSQVQASREYSVAQANESRAAKEWKEAEALSETLRVDSIDTLRSYAADNGLNLDERLHTAVRGETQSERNEALNDLESLALMARGDSGFRVPGNNLDDRGEVDRFFEMSSSQVAESNNIDKDIVGRSRAERLGDFDGDSIRGDANDLIKGSIDGRNAAKGEIDKAALEMRWDKALAEKDSDDVKKQVDPDPVDRGTSIYDETETRRRERMN